MVYSTTENEGNVRMREMNNLIDISDRLLIGRQVRQTDANQLLSTPQHR